jgi:hypothetical protein
MLGHVIREKGYIYLNNECPVHGNNCPHNGQSSLQVGRILKSYQAKAYVELRKLSIKELIKLANCDCAIVAVQARCALSRRLAIFEGVESTKIKDEDLKAVRDINSNFIDFVKYNLWYIIRNASARVKVSIIETLAETPDTAAAAITSNTFIKTLRLARMVTDPKSKPIDCHVTQFRKEEGIRTSCCVASDTAQVLLIRLRSLLFNNPLVWIFLYDVLKHDIEDEKHIFNTADKIHFYRLWDQSPIKLSSKAISILKPSSANLKYTQLYKEHHKKHSQYGSSSFMPEKDKSFLLMNKCQKVMDYGCGKSDRSDLDFTWVKYDPCINEYSTPYNDKVDGVICYDVLEHVPLDELDVFVKWVSLYSPRAIVLGICTRTAVAVLGNGENAHCTVRDTEWWVKWAKKAFAAHYTPSVEVKSFAKCRDTKRTDHVTLHIKPK